MFEQGKKRFFLFCDFDLFVSLKRLNALPTQQISF